jgi:O-antigen ligase
LVSVFLLVFWHFRQTDWHPAHRAFSAINTVDFSWRNRIAAWEGTLQIMTEHPWLGTGWEQPEPLFENYYLPPKLIESAAVEMNDYLMLGATLGIPALFCFGMYLWLSLSQKSKVRIMNYESSDAEWLKTTCQAGALVLAVCFWFDGGLFKLATAATFWVLLELGNAETKAKD